MGTAVQMGFEPKGVVIPVGQILPVKAIRPEMRRGQQYLRLAASIREIGVIEPLIVFPQAGAPASDRRYTLLDGHFRLDVLKELGRTEVFCLIATDDEAFAGAMPLGVFMADALGSCFVGDARDSVLRIVTPPKLRDLTSDGIVDFDPSMLPVKRLMNVTVRGGQG